MTRIRLRPACRSLALIPPPAHPEMTPIAVLPSLPDWQVAVPFIVADDFYDDPEVWGLPECALSALMLVGPWSARNNQSGFIPAKVLARFSTDPELVVKALLEARIIEAAKGDWRIIEGRGLTVVNAAEAAPVAEAPAATEQSAKSAAGQLGNHQRWHEQRGTRSPACGFCTPASPVDNSLGNRTSHGVATDSGATPIDRSDLDHLSPVSPKQERSRPAARKGNPSRGSQAFRLAIIAKVAETAGADISPETADLIASEVLSGRKVNHPLGYVLTAIEDEEDPFRRWLAGYRRPAPRKPVQADWCGRCDKYDRRLSNDAGQVTGHCPDCSPRAVAPWGAIAS